MILHVWSLDQMHQSHLETILKCKLSGSTPRFTESEAKGRAQILGLGSVYVYDRKLSGLIAVYFCLIKAV